MPQPAALTAKMNANIDASLPHSPPDSFARTPRIRAATACTPPWSACMFHPPEGSGDEESSCEGRRAAAREPPFLRGPVIADKQPGGRTRPLGRGFTVAGQCRDLTGLRCACLLYTSDAADDLLC